jgi:hypothetical protein
VQRPVLPPAAVAAPATKPQAQPLMELQRTPRFKH